jgi:excisionase family DNA binding protein
MPVNQLLKPQELAALLAVPISFVYDRTRQNALDPIPHLKLGKYVRFELAQVEAWLAERSK